MQQIYIQEVGTRDGFQIEPTFIPTEDKIRLINRLSRTGISKIEVTSFVSPKAVPNLRDAEEVLKSIDRVDGVVYTALIPNIKGAVRALANKLDEINLVLSVSETHNQKNVNRNTDDSFNEFKDIINMFQGTNIKINGSLGTSFGCPFEGNIPEDRVLSFIERYLDLGVSSISLADTTGMAHPLQVNRLATRVKQLWPNLPVTLHFHNTRGMGLANVLEGIRAGIDRYDASFGGIGGCPFAPGATGNVCTEDLVHMLEFMGYQTGVDLDQLISIAKELQQIIGRELPGQIIKAGKITDLHQ